MNDPLNHFSSKLEYETDSWDLNAAREAGENITIVDARSPAAFNREHIPGAINIPHRTMSPDTTNRIDKSSLVVTYCDGIGCNASTKGALNMVKLGFRVKELMGGLDWWKRDGYKTHADALHRINPSPVDAIRLSMYIEGIDHIQLAMPAGQEDVARGFYSGLLGIPEIPKPPDLARRGGAWFESDRVKVHLGIDPDFRPARKAHPALLVKDLRALVRKLAENDIAVVDAEPMDHYDHVYVSDPFGNRIELMERRP